MSVTGCWILCCASGFVEALCREALPLIYERKGVTAGFRIGSCWTADTQIDLVGVRDDGWIDLAELKWADVSASSRADEVEKKIPVYANPDQAAIGRRLFARSFKRSRRPLRPGIRTHTLEQLCDQPRARIGRRRVEPRVVMVSRPLQG